MNKKVYQNRLRQMMLKCFALVLFLTAGAAFSTLTAQNQGAVANRTISKQVSATRVSVTGQMPQAAQVTVTQVQRSAVQGKQVKGAYDITIKNGTAKWQPAAGQPAMVTISDANFVDGEYMDVYHEGANGPEFVATVSPENGKITFPARSFSVYIVTETGQDARLKVNFYQNSDQVTNNNPVVIYVKKADITGGHYNSIVYDPGAGTLASGVTFFGWVEDKPNYTIEDTAAATALTIAEIRAEVQTKLNGSFSDGDEVNYYAMLFKTYIVSYYDGSPATLGSDNLFFRADATQTQYPYQISRTYVPTSSEYNFMGWVVKDETPSTAANIVNPQTDGLYEFGDNITIQGNVNFSVDEEQGHWLVFDENGKGATYNAPQFVKNGDVTSDADLLPMTRPGYTFGGWYKEPECTTAFTFGGELTERTIIYAKWTAHTTADYSVIVWMQKLTDQSNANNPNADYDFGQTFRIEDGAVGTHPNVVGGTAGASSVTIDGHSVSEQGFHYASTDQATVTITPEGTSVVNVYLDRDVITLNFYTRPNNTGNNWSITTTMSGRYGSTLSQNNQTWPATHSWNSNQNGNGTTTTFLDAFLPTSNSTTVNFYGFALSGNRTAYFYKQNPDGNGYTQANTVSVSQGNTFLLSDKYNGYKCRAWNTSNNTNTWTEVGGTYTSDGNTYYDANASQSGNQTITIGTALHVYFDVLKYDIEFASGSTFTGNNVTNPETGATTYGTYETTLSPTVLHTESNVAYGLSIEDYEDFEPAESTWPEGYVFDGWYADDQCSTPYTFSTMPANNVMLYAKWRQIRFRVFLHPNAYIDNDGTLVKDETLDWGSETQAMNFAVAWGGKISVPTGRRSSYEFIGWFTDPEFQHPFDKDAIILNNTNVPATPVYVKTQAQATELGLPIDYTDNMDKWGEITNLNNGAYNSDANRPWTLRKFDLYAQWRATVDGAIGIDVVYDANGGTNAPTDQNHYLDAAKATAGAASTAPSNTKVFSHWVVQKYNCTSNEFEDTQVTVFPGETFTIHRDDSRITVSEWCDPLDDSPQNHPQARYAVTPAACNHLTPPTATYVDPETGETRGYTKIYDAEYIIHLRAEYVDIEQPQPTFIIWYNNYTNASPAILRQDGNTGATGDQNPELIVNHAVTIPTPADRAGYKFLGWYKKQWQAGQTPTETITETAPNFLYYNETDHKFYAESTFENEATEVAADEMNPYDYLYAIWEQTCVIPQVTVAPVTVCENETATLEATITNSDDQEEGVTYSYKWYTVNTSQEATEIQGATNSTYDAPAAGTYGVIVSIGEDCASEMVTAVVTINPLPTVTLTVPTEAADLCPNQGTYEVSATASNGTAPYTYAWTGATAQTNDNSKADVAQQGQSDCTPNGTTYNVSVVVTDANNCASASAEGSFTVKMATGGISMTQVTNTAEVDCAADVAAPTTFPVVTDACANTLNPSDPVIAPTTAPACGGDVTYTYTYTDCAGNTDTWVYTVTVKEPANPTLTLQTATATAAGECKYKIPAVEYTAAAACNGTVTVTQNPAANTLVEQTEEEQTITITVTATDGCQKTTEATTTVTIPAKPTASITANPTTICKGEQATLTASDAASYAWSNNENTKVITVTPETTTTYTVTCTDANGCTAEAPQEITVNELPTVTLTVPTSAQDLCPNQGTYEVSATASNGTAPYTYAWTGATAQTNDNSKADVAQQGQSDCTPNGTTYNVSVVVTDANNCASASAEGSFTVKMATGGISMTQVTNTAEVDCAADVAAPTTFPVVTDACANTLNPSDPVIAPTTAPACGGDVTYTYTYTDCAGNTDTWVYTVTVKEPANPTLTLQTATATAAGECKYKIPAVGYTAAAACNGTLTVTQSPEANTLVEQTAQEQTITITVTATDGCQKTTTATTTVTIPAKPTVTITPSATEVCYGGSATLTASEGFASYAWSNQGTGREITVEDLTANASFTVTATDANACTAEATQSVTVNDIAEATITGTSVICKGASTTLTAPAGATYAWESGEMTQAITVSPTTTTTYKVTVKDAYGCTSAGEIEVTVNPLPEVAVTSTPACQGSNAVLTANATNVSYQWKNANGNISGATNATYSTNVAGEYTVEVTDLTIGCKNTASATAVINPNPVIALDSVRPTCTEKGSITVNVTPPTVANYTYTMNNEAPVTTNLTSYTFGGLNAGSYSFTLTDANGCSATAAQTLTLDQDEIVLTPITMDVCNNYEFDTIPNGANDQIKYAWAAPQCDPNISDTLYQSSWANTPQGTIKGKLVNSGSQAGHAVYTVTPTLGDCALGVVTVTVTVDAVVRPEVSLNIDATSPVCANQGDLDVTAEVTNSTLGYTLTWTWQGEETPQTAQVGTGSVTHTIAIPSDVDMPSTYTLQLAYNDGVCRAATSTEIVVNPLPTLTVTPATQTITFGDPMNDVLVDTANVSALNVAAPAGFTFNNMILSYNMDPRGNMPPVGTHTIYLNAPGLAPCGTAVDSVKVIVNPRPLTIKVDCEKMYDGTPFVVNYDNTECVTVTGLATGDALTAGTATTAVGTTPSYKVGHYTYTPASGLSFAAIEDGDVLVNPAFASTFGLENYDVTYDIALDITLRPITITAHDSTKMYDGVALTDTIYTISEPGLAVNDTIAMIAQNGSLFCVGTADHTISNALILKTDDNNADVTDQYDITYVNGTLTVTDYTEFECPEDLTIKLNFGQCDTMFEPVDLATISENAPIAEGMYTITNNLDELNPLDTGVHVITWTLTDTCNHIMATCDQTVTVVFRECPVAVDADSNTYQSVRIGCDCWTQTNLVSETYGSKVGGGAIEDVMTYNATPYFDDEAANEQTYGHLYTWNAAIKDGADNGYGHIQGICPDGWYLPTKEKYEGLGAYGPEALRADILWADGGGTNTTGFTGLPGGRYVGNILLYRDMTIMDYYWATTTDAAGQASAVEVELTMNCLRVKNVLNTNPNGYSIRCIKEREPETEGTETTEP